jgi:hypothetical protein
VARQLTEALLLASSWEDTLRLQGSLKVLHYIAGGTLEAHAEHRAGMNGSDHTIQPYQEPDASLGTED